MCVLSFCKLKRTQHCCMYQNLRCSALVTIFCCMHLQQELEIFQGCHYSSGRVPHSLPLQTRVLATLVCLLNSPRSLFLVFIRFRCLHFSSLIHNFVPTSALEAFPDPLLYAHQNIVVVLRKALPDNAPNSQTPCLMRLFVECSEVHWQASKQSFFSDQSAPGTGG